MINKINNYLSKVKLKSGVYNLDTKEIHDYEFPNLNPNFFEYLKQQKPLPNNLVKAYKEFLIIEKENKLTELLLYKKIKSSVKIYRGDVLKSMYTQKLLNPSFHVMTTNTTN